MENNTKENQKNRRGPSLKDEPSKVVVLRTTEKQIEQHVNKIFKLAGGIEHYIQKGDKVLIKPNFLAPKKSSTGTTTNLSIIEAVIKAVLKQKAIPIVGEGGPISFDTEQTFKRLGMDRIAHKYHVKLIDTNKYPCKTVKIKDHIQAKEILVSKLVFEVDKIIDLPVLKTHTLTTVTLGMKNLKGCLPGNEKLRFHKLGVSGCVVDLCTIIKPTFTIIDGIVGMEGAGPTNGKPKRMNLLIGSGDLLASEIIGAKIMGFNPYSITHIRLSKDKGIGEYDLRKIKVLGEKVEKVKSKFSFPIINLNKVFSSILLGRMPLFFSRHGVDVTKIANSMYKYFLPYPFFIDKCTGCARCIINCPEKAIKFKGKLDPIIDRKKCIKCYVCDEVCIYDNVRIKGRE